MTHDRNGRSTNETNQLFRAIKDDVRERRNKQEPQLTRVMHETCAKLGVGVRQLDQYKYRLTCGAKQLDYIPRTRRVMSGNDTMGWGLHEALTLFGFNEPERTR